MNMEPESLQNVFDNAFAGISQVREAFTPELTPREVGTITSIATGIAKVSGLPGVGFDELVTFPGGLGVTSLNTVSDVADLRRAAHPQPGRTRSSSECGEGRRQTQKLCPTPGHRPHALVRAVQGGPFL